MERATGESGFLRLWSIGICLSLFVAVSCNTSTSNSNEASSKRRDREDSPGRIALSLGDNLAQLHYVFLIGAESETARRYEEITAQTVRNDAAKLEIELPPEELSASYDPHATEIIQRIKRSRGTQTAAIFAFVYHSESASWAADWLSRPTGSSRRLDVESGLLRLSMQFHAHAAVQLARALLPTKEILGEADAIESQLSKMSESSSGGRPEEFKAINERLSSLSSTVTLRVYLGSIPPEQQVERASPPAPPQAERRPSRLWILFLAIAVAANLVFAVVAFLFPQREGLLIVSPVIGFACAVTSGFMFSGVLGAIIGGLVFMVTLAPYIGWPSLLLAAESGLPEWSQALVTRIGCGQSLISTRTRKDLLCCINLWSGTPSFGSVIVQRAH
jgi:ABC-type multidrug transport system fused ATPase/permease subunit